MYRLTELKHLRSRLQRAETAEEIASICAIASILGGEAMWCPTCGKQIHGSERVEG